MAELSLSDSGVGADVIDIFRKINPYCTKTSPYSRKTSPYNKMPNICN